MELTVGDVITNLGGPNEVARLTGSKPQAVYNWLREDRIPAKFFLLMSRELERKSMNAPLRVWGMKEPTEASQ